MIEAHTIVTVLLCTYNDEAYIAETIQSILNQSYRNFEFIILNDGSSDRTKDIIHSFKDERIRYLEHSENKGLEDAKNWGIDEAKGKYIAYIDGDDISEPDRLKIQLEYMEAHPEIGICSTRKTLFGLKNKTLQHVEHDIKIRTRALFGTPMEHPSCMIRTEVLRKYNIKYRKNFPIAEDYPFMVDLLEVTQAYCIQIPLIKKRIHDQRISVLKKEIQNESAARASQLAFDVLLGVKARAIDRFAFKRCFLSKSEVRDIVILERLRDSIKMDGELSSRDIEFRQLITDLTSKSIRELYEELEEIHLSKAESETTVETAMPQSTTSTTPSPFRSFLGALSKVITSEGNLPILGLVITQKNEAAILNHNIEYHRYMGISHFYIFDDDSTDESMDTVPDIEGVYKFFETDFSIIPDQMEAIKQKAKSGNWIGRQILNTFKALQLAKEHGVDWLFFIDADELVFLGNGEEDSFRKDFAKIETEIDVVHFNEVFEVAQNGGDNDNIFKSATIFKTLEYDKTKERKILDPMKGEMITLKGFFGHSGGKQAARVNTNLLPVSSHNFKKQNGAVLKKLNLGKIMHYQGYSFEEFIKQNSIPHPSHFVYGNEVPYYPKLFWRNLVLKSGMTTKELREYYERWVMFSEEEVTSLLNQSNPVLVEISDICEIWDKIVDKENTVNEN